MRVRILKLGALTLIAAGALTALAVACSSGGDEGPASTAVAFTATPLAVAPTVAPVPSPMPATGSSVSTGSGPAQQITVRAGERGLEYYLESDPVVVKAGTVQVRFVNEGTRAHTYNVKNLGRWSDMYNFPLVQPGEETSFQFEITQPGDYMYYCMLYGHLDQGQFGTLTVSP
jgi:plastocyanin